MTRFRGFTLIECLVVVGIVAILSTLVLVALRQVKQTSENLDDVASLRATASDFASWAADHDGHMLNPGLPDEPSAAWWYPPGMAPSAAASRYRAIRNQWPLAMHRWSGKVQPHWFGPDGPQGPEGPTEPALIQDPVMGPALLTNLHYSLTMVTAPTLWVYPGRGMTGSQTLPELERVSVAKIEFPAAKGTLINASKLPSGAAPTAFADGHVARVAAGQFRLAAADPTSLPTFRGDPVLATMAGYRGVDH